MADKRDLWIIKAGFPDNPKKKQWSDYVFAYTIKKYLEKRGHRCRVESYDEWKNKSADEAAAVISLRGPYPFFPPKDRRGCFYILWNLSHPDTVTDEEYNAFDLVCTGSEKEEYFKELKKRVKVPLKILPMCVDTENFYPDKDPYGKKEHELVFVGNSRNIARKSVIWATEAGLPIEIWGAGWDKFIRDKERFIVADNMPNNRLRELYHNAVATIDDHYEDMIENGFINTRILEAFACGLPVISDYSEVLIKTFSDAILCYHSREEFLELTDRVLEDHDKIKEKIMALWPMIQERYSFAATVDRLIEYAGIKPEEAIFKDCNKSPDISVIMPVYNCAKYLSDTLNCLLEETYEDFEVICVDDDSDDESLEVLEQYAKKDSRIKVISQEHKGAGAARNLGLLKARGEYLIFLDADDYFTRTLFEKVAKKGRETQAEVILFGAKRYDERTGAISEAPWYLRRDELPDKEIFSRADMDGKLLSLTSPAPWTKAFRREFVLRHNLFFQEMDNSNDAFFVLTAMALAERITAIEEDLVYYRVFRKGSLQDTKDRAPFCFIEAYKAVYERLNSEGVYEDVRRGFFDTVISGCIHNLDTVSEETRLKIAKALSDEGFLEMGVLSETDEYYAKAKQKERLQKLIYSLPVREKLKEDLSLKKTRQIIPVRTKNTIKVSVIIAVHNTEKYVGECLESLINQSLKEIEILCIDDGSTDSSPDIIMSYANKDPRIGLWQQENCGLSETRNRGLKLAKGEYVYFIDSDDSLKPEALKGLYQLCQKDELDMICFDGDVFYDNEGLLEKHPEFESYYIRKADYPSVCPGFQMLKEMHSAKEYRVNVGIEFFKREFLIENELFFLPGILHEDNAFTFCALLGAGRVGYTGETYFNRRIREDSIMTGERGFWHALGYFKSFLKMLSYMEERDFSEELTETLYYILHGVLDNAKRCYKELSEEEKYAALGLTGMDRVYFRLYIEDGFTLYEKLHQTYAEKSEINRKLQITYGEKFDRGLEIKRLKKRISEIKGSRTYRMARLIGAPVRLLRRLFKRERKNG